MPNVFRVGKLLKQLIWREWLLALFRARVMVGLIRVQKGPGITARNRLSQ